MAYRIAICDDEEEQIQILDSMLSNWARQSGLTLDLCRFPSAEAFLFAYEEDSAYDILSAKIAQAKAAGIAVTIKANVPDRLLLSDLELSILVGNLLDNAIESCSAVEGERFLRLFIGMKGKMLYFSMLNSAGPKLSKKGSLFSSRKEGLHGFGLRRAEAILKEHGDWCKYNSEDGAFTSEFLVPAME